MFLGKPDGKDSPEKEKTEHVHPDKVKQKSKTGETKYGGVFGSRRKFIETNTQQISSYKDANIFFDSRDKPKCINNLIND